MIRIFVTILLVSVAILQAEPMEKNAKIYVAGHNGLVGSALMRQLKSAGYENIITRSSKELDLRSQNAVEEFFAKEKPEHVFLAAAKVGGIGANSTYPADFIYDNLMIETNVIHSAYKNEVKKLMFLGSSCIYPRECAQPIYEEYLLNGYLEKTNEAYALAKIAGLKMCQFYNEQYGTNFISCMPTNLYGPHDNFDLKTSHVLPALLAKFVEAKENGDEHVVIWGTGTPRREFLFVDDLANAVVYLMNHYEGSEHVNVGTGVDVSIGELAHLIKDTVGYEGELIYDKSKPDGTPQKLLNVEKLRNIGWTAQTSLEDGIRETFDWYLQNR